MTTATPIDRLSSMPYYQQLCDVLEQRIVAEEIPSGARLPSEHDLCGEFGLSRATVRQALQALENKGLVERVPGRGVFVRQPDTGHGWVIQSEEGFLENAVGHQNRSVETKVLRFGPVPLPSFATRAFGLPDETVGFELVRFRSLDGAPALYSINYSPPSLIRVIAGAEEVLAGKASFSALLSGAGYELGRADRRIAAVTAPKEIGEYLGVRRTAPLLHIRSISCDTQGTCFDLYDTWVRSDLVPLEVAVNAVNVQRRR